MTTLNTTPSPFNKLVWRTMQTAGLDYRSFAEQINEALAGHITIDEHLVRNWAHFDLEPSDTYFKTIIMFFEAGSADWRVEFAFLALAILKPDLFDLESGRMWGLAERIVKFQFINAGAAKERLIKMLEELHD